MPGHKGMEIFEENGCAEELKNIADWDITEISGADNLFQLSLPGPWKSTGSFMASKNHICS